MSHQRRRASLPQPAAAPARPATIRPAAGGNNGTTFTPSAACTQTPAPRGRPRRSRTRPATWQAPNAFLAALGAGAALLVFWLLILGESPLKELKFLDAAWSFNDSWVSNVTVAGGLLAGIFVSGSSSVVTALLGADATTLVALVTVGAAVAAAFVAAAPLVLIAAKGPNGFYTIGGLAAAAALTLGGWAARNPWVVYRSGSKLDLGTWQHNIVYLAVAATRPAWGVRLEIVRRDDSRGDRHARHAGRIGHAGPPTGSSRRSGRMHVRTGPRPSRPSSRSMPACRRTPSRHPSDLAGAPCSRRAPRARNRPGAVSLVRGIRDFRHGADTPETAHVR